MIVRVVVLLSLVACALSSRLEKMPFQLNGALCDCVVDPTPPSMHTFPSTTTVADYDASTSAVKGLMRQNMKDEISSGIQKYVSSGGPSEKDVDECLDFLFRFMPATDKPVLPLSYISETVSLALVARHTMPWGLDVPWHIFLNDVLPYSSLSEPRERWRPLFFTYYSSIPALTQNKTLSLADAATYMNTYGWNIRSPKIVFRADPNPVGVWDYDPFSVLFNGYASCTGLSIFLVSAMRSIGLPARVAGTPHWNLGPQLCPNGDESNDCGNHDWVETWANGGWAFIDEDGNTVLNTSWFVPDWTEHQSPNGLNHSIFAASWANSSYVLQQYGGDSDPLATAFPYFPMVWNWTVFVGSGWDVTSRYLLFSQPKKKM